MKAAIARALVSTTTRMKMWFSGASFVRRSWSTVRTLPRRYGRGRCCVCAARSNRDAYARCWLLE